MVCPVPKKWPPGPTSRIASNARLASSTSIGTSVSAIACSSSASSTIFSNEAVSPPSSQPAAW
ncbi:MAG: hypothetical protein U5K73_00495 [Halofilum sp. (in: g-proteobacteria)]|nr:hypothetical protein [Halofilum sp. (in: g-proteobacteria)]